ncbi:MAG: sigma-70 family RNA polymerase sigma factor [Actinobacteria bacterium]|nr:sigma-70 family RNA polymerase sigma factor [Actinomycetota bacterium]
MKAPTVDASARAVETTFREEHGRVVAALASWSRDLDLAEEAVQEAFAVALEAWRRDGVPARPAAWIITTAKRRAIDRLRRARTLERKRRSLGETATTMSTYAEPDGVEDEVPDERLGLIFACAHPALAREAQLALTLRMLGGLTVPEIARALLSPEATVAKRITRAKAALMPDEPEVLGLTALMLLQDSRRLARLSADGRIVLLADQDRGLWDAREIERGLALLERALPHRAPGPYQVQAAIAALHAQAARAEETDWAEIAALYGELARLHPTPVVALNRAVAVAMADGVEAGLRDLDAAVLGPALDAYLPFHAARADLLRRAGRLPEAAMAYDRARHLATTPAERRYLEERRAELG